MPVICPSCDYALHVSQLACEHCGTQVSGHYGLPVLLQLAQDEQQFVLQFVLASGSLKEMAAHMGISYPTVRNRLDDIIDKIKQLQNEHT